MKNIKLLFICLGNICRSPAAHAVMEHLVEQEGLQDTIQIDSAGIGDWHKGQLPDKRMRSCAAERGFNLMHKARHFKGHEDIAKFDLILVMDDENYRDVAFYAKSQEEKEKIHYLAGYLTHHPKYHIIPDPYYGTSADFHLVLDLIEDACRELLRQLATR